MEKKISKTDDVLDNYPEMLSTTDMMNLLGVSSAMAFHLMDQMNWINVGLGKNLRRRRVKKSEFREKFWDKPTEDAGEAQRQGQKKRA